MKRSLHRNGVAAGESYALVPVRVSRLRVAGGVGFGDVFFGEVPADGAEVLAELFFIVGVHDDVGCGGTLAGASRARFAERTCPFLSRLLRWRLRLAGLPAGEADEVDAISPNESCGEGYSMGR
jgi:hypothetical protein